MLDLQRQAGNKAVSQMVAAQRQTAGGRATAQRAMATRATDLKAQFILRGTYGKIVRALADYEAARAPEIKMEYATAIRGLCNTWLKAHPSPKAGKEKQ